MKDMTRAEAQAEAFRRWGPNGTIRYVPGHVTRIHRGRLARYSCIVGNGNAGSFSSVEGQGHTWLEAFADARPR